MLVYQAGGDKLGKHTKWGHWIGYDSKSNSSLIYFFDIETIKAKYNFLFVNNGHSGLKGEKIPTIESQSSLKPAESLSKILKAPNSISFTPAPLSDIVPNPIIMNEKPNNAIHDCKTDNLPEASVIPTKRPKCTLNPSLSQTSFGHISINSLTILMVSKTTESPQKDLSNNASHVSRWSILAKILSRSTGNHYVTIY